MSACEKCWRDASFRAFHLGGSVVDHYRALLEERKDNPCPPEPPSDNPDIDAQLEAQDEAAEEVR